MKLSYIYIFPPDLCATDQESLKTIIQNIPLGKKLNKGRI